MNTHFKYLLLLTFLNLSPLFAQDHSFAWAKQVGGDKAEQGKSITVDKNGNVYTTGYFSSTGDFDPGAGVFNLNTNLWNRQILVQKLTSDGDLIWAKGFGGSGSDHGEKIRTDLDGNVYVTGSFENTVDFGGFTKTANGAKDIFLMKMSSSGTVLWVEAFGGVDYDHSSDLVIDDAMNIYLTGGFRQSATFGSQTVISNGEIDAFVFKMDQSRNLIWLRTLGKSDSDVAFAIDIDQKGNVYTAGTFVGAVDFDPHPNNDYDLSSNNASNDVYIQKLDSMGNFIWAKSLGGDWSDTPQDIHLDKDENLYITGRFGLTVDFDSSPNTSFLTANGDMDAFILKLDTAGQFIWAKSWGAANHEIGMSITTDDNGNIYTAGYFWGFVDFDPNSTETSLWSKGNGDFFISKLKANGDFLWARSGGGPYYDFVWEITLNQKNELYLIGDFSFTGNFHTDWGTYNMTANSGGYTDVLLLKLDYCAPSDSTLNIASCVPYLAPDNQTYDTSGQYIVQLSNEKGCDSILTINLTMHELQALISLRNDTLFSIENSGLTYQWYDCQTQNPINNATTSYFYPSNSGTYAVDLSNGSCSAPSNCITLDLNIDLLIYPNPTSENIFIDKNRNGEITAKIYDAIGQLLKTKLLKDKITPLDFSNYTSGVYLLVLEGQHGLSTHKIIRE
ncbi:MAG: SBBP repeat-containing protein [Aureispira sp.]|nr:SBBP repeat-containing protein [Aureispira sp.]